MGKKYPENKIQNKQINILNFAKVVLKNFLNTKSWMLHMAFLEKEENEEWGIKPTWKKWK